MKLYGPSLHQIRGKQFALEMQVECINKAGAQIIVLVLFKIETAAETSSHLLRELGLGTGKLKTMANNKVLKIGFKHDHAFQDLIDQYYYVNYRGNSMFSDNCDLENPDTEYFLVTQTVKISK